MIAAFAVPSMLLVHDELSKDVREAQWRRWVASSGKTQANEFVKTSV
jgi:hypothetical protein